MIAGTVDGSVVNTASEASLSGSQGQANYAAVKAGITALTLSTARGLAKIDVQATSRRTSTAPRSRSTGE